MNERVIPSDAIIRSDFKKYFNECEVDGTVVILDNKHNQWYLSDTSSIFLETLPASTFKIVNMLIALETNAISDENEVIKWQGITDTLKYGYRPEIYHDLSIKEAFQVSAVWAFLEITKKIDRDIYRKYLLESGYGNLNLSESAPDFWNFGPMGITPLNQVQFLKRLYDGTLPFSKRNMDIVKRVMLSEQDPSYTIRAKTGWTRYKEQNNGWWVGYVEAKDNVFFFATRLLQERSKKRKDFAQCRKDITKAVLKSLQVIQ